MGLLGNLLNVIGGIGMLVCFILVLIQMFQRGATGMAILCIVLFFCCYFGGLIAFIYGWTKSKEWGIQNIMIAWTVFIILAIVGAALSPDLVTRFQTLPNL